MSAAALSMPAVVFGENHLLVPKLYVNHYVINYIINYGINDLGSLGNQVRLDSLLLGRSALASLLELMVRYHKQKPKYLKAIVAGIVICRYSTGLWLCRNRRYSEVGSQVGCYQRCSIIKSS